MRRTYISSLPWCPHGGSGTDLLLLLYVNYNYVFIHAHLDQDFWAIYLINTELQNSAGYSLSLFPLLTFACRLYCYGMIFIPSFVKIHQLFLSKVVTGKSEERK
jgi:hypothetical protein